MQDLANVQRVPGRLSDQRPEPGPRLRADDPADSAIVLRAWLVKIHLRSRDGAEVVLADDDPVTRVLLTDPQTSGGLLVACAADAVEAVLALFRAEGFAQAACIGEFVAGPAQVTVR